ncbi:MAG: transposase [Gammaproteobacteria bacterium]|nr:transposase [Gammaproteobacteria bacterium]
MTLKLNKLPDREAVKVTFTASAELKAALNDYAEVYRRAYGQKEGVAELIPFMLEAFMNADPGFKRARKALDEARPSSSPQLKET